MQPTFSLPSDDCGEGLELSLCCDRCGARERFGSAAGAFYDRHRACQRPADPHVTDRARAVGTWEDPESHTEYVSDLVLKLARLLSDAEANPGGAPGQHERVELLRQVIHAGREDLVRLCEAEAALPTDDVPRAGYGT